MFKGLFTCLLTTDSSIIFNNKMVKQKNWLEVLWKEKTVYVVCLEKSFHFHWGAIQVPVLSEALEE